MNNNMYGQPNGTNGVPQNLAQPNMQPFMKKVMVIYMQSISLNP